MTETKSPQEHVITELVSPIAVHLRCSCGWSCTITRKQNALARAAKIKSAIRRHDIETKKARGT